MSGIKLVRVDSDRRCKNVERIEVEINDVKYTITEYFGEIKLHSNSGDIIVKPCCANEILVKGSYLI